LWNKGEGLKVHQFLQAFSLQSIEFVEMPELDTIPGTIHLVDVQRNLRVRHAGGGEGDIVLDPAPSDDPNDPLNWSPQRKRLALICQNL